MNTQDFEITSTVWHEVQDKIDVVQLEQLLNNNLRLSIYGSGIQKIYFKYIAMIPNQNLHENICEYDELSKVLRISHQLEYNQVVSGNRQQVYSSMKKLYLECLIGFQPIQDIDFEKDRLVEDLHILFERS